MGRKKALLGPQSLLPGFRIRLVGSIHRTATMTCDFPAHGRHRSSRHWPISRIDEPEAIPRERAPPDRRNKPTVTRHQTTNGRMLLAKGAPDLVQRLSRLPTAPHVALLRGRKSKPFPLGHKHHL